MDFSIPSVPMRRNNFDEQPAISRRTNYSSYDDPGPSSVPNTTRERYSPIALPPPSSNQRPETYHLDSKRNEMLDDDNPTTYNDRVRATPNHLRPEFYHISADGSNESRTPRATPGLMATNNRVSPMPYPDPMVMPSDRPEMYHLGEVPVTTGNYSRMNDYRSSPMDRHDEMPLDGKATVYLLDANRENRPVDNARFRERTPSPPIPTKKKPLPPPVSDDVVEDDVPYTTPRKPVAFPTPLATVSSNVRYVPLAHSKASESIQRSMMKYRFL